MNDRMEHNMMDGYVQHVHAAALKNQACTRKEKPRKL